MTITSGRCVSVEGDTLLRNVGDHFSSDAAPLFKRPEFSIGRLLQPQKSWVPATRPTNYPIEHGTAGNAESVWTDAGINLPSAASMGG
jgi:hypothetical protein